MLNAHFFLGEAYVAKEMYKEGVAEMQKAVALDNAPERWDRYPMLAYAYAVAGRRDEALKILDEQKRLAKQRYISPYNFAIIYTGLGDKDRAFEWLTKVLSRRTHWYIASRAGRCSIACAQTRVTLSCSGASAVRREVRQTLSLSLE